MCRFYSSGAFLLVLGPSLAASETPGALRVDGARRSGRRFQLGIQMAF